ncbi:MAG: DUF6268 family outer membrane beta-barrel protein [Lutibacter sp.]|uniref:DUF6268 family outer membrane beta-barrel protein n=1 Tax=Lutibacter sp. TaxID=1925666 RepID=UPI00385D9A31
MSVLNVMNAQNLELLNVEFNSTLNDENSIGFKNTAIKINFPVKLKKGVLLNSLSFSTNKIDYNSEISLNTSTIENFKTIKYAIGFLNNINKTWKFKARIAPTISSNFDSNITSNDVFINGSLVFMKVNNGSKLRLGLAYNSGFGMNTPIPVLSYSRKVSDTFSYTLGMPETKLEYTFSKYNKLNLYIKPRGFYSNISNNIILDSSEEAEKAKYTTVISGFNYLHQIDDFWNISINAGYQISSKYNLLNGNDSVYEFETKNNLFVGLNLKFELLNKKN